MVETNEEQIESKGSNEAQQKAQTLADEQYRAMQSKIDAERHENEVLKSKLKTRMDDEEREKFELAEQNRILNEQLNQVAQEKAKVEAEAKLIKISQVKENLIAKEFPELDTWKDRNFGNTEEEIRTNMQAAQKELDIYKKKHLKTSEPLTAESSKMPVSSGEEFSNPEIIIQRMKGMSTEEKIKFAKDNGISI
ncbi:hypothetical protein M0R04_12220 [Candidatus Dojkabacteria bacterium]|jgi:hypothetical protein|nr:hypothetical protein [Candidatus Dojkabacteria bacterium]